MAGGTKLTEEEELLLQTFSRNLSAKSYALLYANAFFVSAIPLCKFVDLTCPWYNAFPCVLCVEEGHCLIAEFDHLRIVVFRVVLEGPSNGYLFLCYHVRCNDFDQHLACCNFLQERQISTET